MTALNLFWIFFKVGLISFGGGNAMLGAFEQLLVNEYAYMTQKQFADMVAISQITPGPVAVNLSTYTGALAGSTFFESLFYSFMATLGMSLPSFIVVLFVAKFFRSFGESKAVVSVMGGIKPAVIGLLLGATLLLCRLSLYDEALMKSGNIVGSLNLGAIAISVIALTLSLKTKINPIIVLLGSGILGILIL